MEVTLHARYSPTRNPIKGVFMSRPYSFASTSHFILAFSLSFSIVLGATILGLSVHGLKFFSLFVPAGCPLGLLPLLVLIEFISYLSRAVSLGLRLAANIVSGHLLLAILSGFTYNIMLSGFFFFVVGLLPLLFIIAFCGLEIAISFIQAQVFVVLTSSYIKDALDLHGDSPSPKVGATQTFIPKNNPSKYEIKVEVYPEKIKTLNQQRSYSTLALKTVGVKGVRKISRPSTSTGVVILICVKRQASTSNGNAGTLDPYYISGFIDAEGCFFVRISRNDELKVK
jgi:F-type H+-transporting ATPase subunit a